MEDVEHAPVLIQSNGRPIAGLREMLLELGDGENGFSGTPFGRGELSLGEYLAELEKFRGYELPNGFVPSTVYWMVSEARAAGVLRLRHYLNDALRVHGGHIGYYVAPFARGRGLASRALGEALVHLRALGETRAMLTTNPDNWASIRVIEKHGGRLTNQITDEEGITNQYWIG